MFPSIKRWAVLAVLVSLISFLASCGGSRLIADTDDESGSGGETTEFALHNVDLSPVAQLDSAMIPRDCQPGWDGCP